MGSRPLSELFLRPPPLPLIRSRPAPRPTTCMWQRASPTWTAARRSISQSQSAQDAQPQPRLKTEDTIDTPANPKPRTNPDLLNQVDDVFPAKPPIRHHLFAANSKPANGSRDPLRHFGSDFLTQAPGQARPRKLDIGAMQFGDAIPDAEKPKAIRIPEKDKIYPRLTPAYGRTVDLDPGRGRDLVRGLNMLGSLVGRNKIKRDTVLQKFHERPGLKRKRLRSERWRARFKDGFQDMCTRVSELTRKGW